MWITDHNIVCSYELAKRLRNIGVPQRSKFYWCKWCEPGREPIYNVKMIPNDPGAPAAFTVSELEEMLPYEYVLFRNGNKWRFYHSYYDVYYTCKAETLADAFASFIIQIKQNLEEK